ncbi:hypothetical protein [Streptomyces mayteni]
MPAVIFLPLLVCYLKEGFMAKRMLLKVASKMGFTTKGAAGAYPWIP